MYSQAEPGNEGRLKMGNLADRKHIEKKELASRKTLLEKELQRIFDLLVKQYNPRKIILFGSLAKNSIHESSDIDLLIIKESEKRHLERIDEVMQLTHPRVGMDIFILTPNEIKQALKNENRYLEEIITGGKLLYEKSG